MRGADRIALLGGIAILRGVPPDELERLAQVCNWSTFEPEELVLAHMDRSTSVQFLTAGRARVVIHSANGKAVLLSHIEAGGTFGELAAIDGKPRSASVEAVESSIVASLASKDLMALLRRQPEVAISLLTALAADVRRLDERVLEFSTLSVRGRVLAELLRVARSIDATASEVVIAPAPSLSELSSRISTHREAVSRELSRLSQLGVAQREGSALRVLSVVRLAEMVEAMKGDEAAS